MTEIEIDDKSVRITGHAGSGGIGKDLVCCAVSTAWYMLRHLLSSPNYSFNGVVTQEVEGDCRISFETADSEGLKAFRESTDFFRQLAEEYPEYVKIK